MKKATLLLVTALLMATSAWATGPAQGTFAVTITNITQGQTFTPLLVATHKRSISFFQLGEPASKELATIAESGMIGPLKELLDSLPNLVLDTGASEGLLGPGESVTVYVKGGGRFNRISVAGMLIPTNDTFVALNSAYLFSFQRPHTVPAYDAGSEYNDELCDNIPGPVCGGKGPSDGTAENYVHISSGIHGIGDLDPSAYDWRNPVASISVRRAH